tara:strand:+ start:14855 stop:15751 length:897 start_codon:yes stop_codon:yes gene_type:complete
MKSRLILILSLLVVSIAKSQINAVVINSKTKEKIPYVNIWVENESIGTSSDENGHFSISEDIADKYILFSAIGFETKKILADLINSSVELTPQSININEVKIIADKRPKKLVIGSLKKSKVNCHLRSSTLPWIATRYYEYSEIYSKTPYLNSVKIYTISETKDAKFNIRLYAVNQEGLPENYIYDKNIIATAKKGYHLTEVDLSAYKIPFPKNGFFLAVEWLIIDSNKFEFTVKNQESKKKVIRVSYSPMIGTTTHKTNNKSWFLSEGIWRNRAQICGLQKQYPDKYSTLAVELTLSN